MTDASEPHWTAGTIRALRGRMELSQEKFAARLGVSFATVHRWEKGKTMPRGVFVQVLEGLAQSLSLPMTPLDAVRRDLDEDEMALADAERKRKRPGERKPGKPSKKKPSKKKPSKKVRKKVGKRRKR